MGATVAARNKKVREEALREQLRNKGLVQQVLEISEKLNNQYLKLENSHINALKASAELKLKLVNKYMPDLKAIEHSQDPDNPISELADAELKSSIAELVAKLNGS